MTRCPMVWRGRWPISAALGGLKQFDQIAGRVLQQDLGTARPLEEGVAKGGTLGGQRGNCGLQIIHPQHDPAPATRTGCAPSGMGFDAEAIGPATTGSDRRAR